MADITLAANADWTTCNGGSPPGASDNVYLNNYDLTLDGAGPFTCSKIAARAADGTTKTDGKIIVGSGVTITINADQYAGTEDLLTLTDQDVTCTGTTYGGDGSTDYGVQVSGTAVFRGNVSGDTTGGSGRGAYVNGGTLIGDCTGGSASSSYGAYTGSVGGTVTGTFTGGSGVNAYGILAQYLTICTGNAVAGSAHGAYITNGGILNGNSIAGATANAYGSYVTAGGIQNGNATGGSVAGAHGAYVIYGGLFNGNATGGSANNANGAFLLFSGIANVGVATGETSGAYGVYTVGSNTIAIVASEVGDYAKSLSPGTQTDNTNVPFIGGGGGGYAYGDDDPAYVLTTADGAGNYVPIADSDTVDGGVSYGAGEEGTGVNAETIRTALGLASANLDTQLATISGYVDCLPASWVPVPTAAQNATQVRSELTTELGRIDATISSRQATVANLGTLVTDWTDGGRLDALLDAAATGASGDGAYTGTLTVTDDEGTALQGAVVNARLNDLLVATGTTDADGEITDWAFNARTYDLAIRCAGYQSTTDTVSVSGNGWSKTVELEELSSYTPSTETDTVTVRWLIKKADRTTAGAGDATVYLRISQGPDNDALGWKNSSFDSDATDSSGYVEFTNVPVGCTVIAKIGEDGTEQEFEIPTTATSPYEAGTLMEDLNQ